MRAVTSHVLDTVSGKPAAGVMVTLSEQRSDGWHEMVSRPTDAEGRFAHLVADGESLRPGTYRLRFAAGDYQKRQGMSEFYPYVDVIFTIEDADQQYHIPLLLSPHGYTTYRGS